MSEFSFPCLAYLERGSISGSMGRSQAEPQDKKLFCLPRAGAIQIAKPADTHGSNCWDLFTLIVSIQSFPAG